MSSRASAITAAGIVLSQPTRQTSPSNRWPRATSSIESAITSRETSEARIPSVPIDTPSETAIVLNSIGVPPASRMPRLTCCASARWFRLHGIVSIQFVATPTSGRARSSSVKPVPFSIARAGARSAPSVSAALCRLAGSVGRSYGSAAVSSVDTRLPGGLSGRLLPRHQRAELTSDLLDLALARGGPKRVQVALAGLHLRDPLTRERAVLDLREHLAHLPTHVLVDDAVAAGEVAVLGGVGDRPAHVREAALPDQIDDQLQLVQALVVGDFRLVPRLDERLEAGADQLGGAAAEDGLLAEEVGLRLLLECGLDHAGAARAERGAVGEGELERATARVLCDRDDRRCAEPFGEKAADDVAGALRRDHEDVVAAGRLDPAVVDVEAVREHERRALAQVRRHVLLVDARLHLVREKEGDELRILYRFGNRADGEPRRLGRVARRTPRPEPDHHVDTGVVQVERVRVALAAEAENRDLACEQVDVAARVDLRHFRSSLRCGRGACSCRSAWPKHEPTRSGPF